MIPKVIHWCWFGRGKYSPLVKKCIESWKKYLPDYEIKEWNEDNFDIHCNKYVEEAYQNKKWAFVTDYVRLYALYHEGGIYMDSDVEVLKSLDCFLELPAFSGFESNETCPTGIMASQKGGRWVEELLNEYNDRSFVKLDGSLNLTTNVVYITEAIKRKGVVLTGEKVDISNYVVLFPKDYFCPKSHATGKITTTPNTYTIHHFAGSWFSRKAKCVLWVERHLGAKIAKSLNTFWSNPITLPRRFYAWNLRRREQQTVENTKL